MPPNNDVTGEVPGKPPIPPTASAPGPPKPRAPLNRAFERMIRISSRCALWATASAADMAAAVPPVPAGTVDASVYAAAVAMTAPRIVPAVVVTADVTPFVC